MKTLDDKESKLLELQKVLTILRLELNNLEIKMSRVSDTIYDIQNMVLDIKYGEIEYV